MDVLKINDDDDDDDDELVKPKSHKKLKISVFLSNTQAEMILRVHEF